MSTYKKLAGDTAIYGISSIAGRILNWFLAPFYTFIFIAQDYGIVTNLYSYVAFFLVLLTFGMETSFFRYAAKNKNDKIVYSTSLISLVFTSLSFILLVTAFRREIASLIQYPNHPEYISWLAIILGIDALTAIPFAWLRLKNRPVKFAFLKLVGIAINIGFNLFFYLLCPKIIAHNPDSFIRIIYSPNIGVGYVFISNLIASAVTLILLLPEIFKIEFKFDKYLMVKMANYGFPILIVGLTGMINQNLDKILIPFLLPQNQDPMFQLGIYGANYKLAVLMNMFIQAFRYAFEPFFFARNDSAEDPKVYATVMKYFVIFGLLIFLGMILYIDIIKIIIESEYRIGLKVVPIILMANLFFGIYFALSLWYKLKDMTRYGAYISMIGAAITLILNFILIPVMGYMGSAITVFICFLTMMIISFVLGQKYYPIPYDLKRIGTYFLIAAIIYLLSLYSSRQIPVIKFSENTFFLLIFVFFVFKMERNELKSLFKINKKK